MSNYITLTNTIYDVMKDYHLRHKRTMYPDKLMYETARKCHVRVDDSFLQEFEKAIKIMMSQGSLTVVITKTGERLKLTRSAIREGF